MDSTSSVQCWPTNSVLITTSFHYLTTGVYDSVHGADFWPSEKNDRLTRYTAEYHVYYAVSPYSGLLWIMMTQHYRHGISILRFSETIPQKLFFYKLWLGVIQIIVWTKLSKSSIKIFFFSNWVPKNQSSPVVNSLQVYMTENLNMGGFFYRTFTHLLFCQTPVDNWHWQVCIGKCTPY